MQKPLLWIDTDTGVDDALTLISAAGLEREGLIILKGVSAVCGNVAQEKTFRNARNVLNLAGRPDIPVYPGAEKPLCAELETAERFHGRNGVGDVILPESPAPKETEKAWDALYRTAKEYSGQLELILIGPETNASIAFQKHPDLKEHLKRILIMGGAAKGGNRTPNAEFNIYADPDAASYVFSSGVPIVMCGLDVTMKAVFRPDEIAELEKYDSAACRFFRDSTVLAQKAYRKQGYDGYFLHDSCPLMYAVWPDMFEGEESCVTVETEKGPMRGRTAVSHGEEILCRNALVIRDIDRERFVKTISGLLKEI